MINKGMRWSALFLAASSAATAFLVFNTEAPNMPAEPPSLSRQEAALTPPAPTNATTWSDQVAIINSASAAIPVLPVKPDLAKPYDKTLRVGKGDTLMELMVDAGVARSEAHNAIAAMGEIYNPRKIKPGQIITVTFDPSETETVKDEQKEKFLALTLAEDIETEIAITRDDDGTFKANKIEKPLERRLARASGTIQDSLYLAAEKAGVPVSVLMELIQAYSWDVDFQRDIQPNDRFEVMFERYYTEDGELARSGDILYAALELSGDNHPIYRHETEDGRISYFDDKGRSAKKALMRTPINGARLSSGFGNRRHPILGYTKRHTGVDFAAPRGTPIYAAGDGVVDYAGRKGGYGKYIQIRHNSTYSTAYAHMHNYAKGMQKGKRVRQGQIIGYVGSTGRSTGPHLHYEILYNGAKVNPLTVKMPSGEQLKGKELLAFNRVKEDLASQFASLETTLSVASK